MVPPEADAKTKDSPTVSDIEYNFSNLPTTPKGGKKPEPNLAPPLKMGGNPPKKKPPGVLPQPSDASDVPVIPVAEAGRLFDSFLQLWYPGAQLLMTFSGVEELNTLLELTLCKYDLPFLAPALENYLQAYIEQHPVGVFALACQYGWGQLARTAAKQSLNFDFRTVCLRSGNNSQIKHISVELFQALLVYHDACGVAASSAGRLLPWTDPRYSWIRCASCAAHTASSEVPGLGPRFSRAWIIDYLDEAAAMLKARPGASVEDHLFLANTQERAALCPSFCRVDGLCDFAHFIVEKYVPAVNAAIDAVPLEIPF
ncbi:hypothetical protein MSAN_02480100 [Mycena sanguinolenta]|uniref:Uncharacterized protein n=1 Tax=Mycena sanguinolenta TaxID=230812 RepID=A0A8H6WSQ2_9AGAR|nr:hypothetical protein MSAN_02480100 [Mycena sanguinolenta]